VNSNFSGHALSLFQLYFLQKFALLPPFSLFFFFLSVFSQGSFLKDTQEMTTVKFFLSLCFILISGGCGRVSLFGVPTSPPEGSFDEETAGAEGVTFLYRWRLSPFLEGFVAATPFGDFWAMKGFHIG